MDLFNLIKAVSVVEGVNILLQEVVHCVFVTVVPLDPQVNFLRFLHVVKLKILVNRLMLQELVSNIGQKLEPLDFFSDKHFEQVRFLLDFEQLDSYGDLVLIILHFVMYKHTVSIR